MGEVEAPLQGGYGDKATSVSDHRPGDLQHQASAGGASIDEIERQLSGFKLSQDVKSTLGQNDEMPPLQKRSAEMVMTFPGTTIEEEFRHRSAAIDAVASYCHFR
ncbi:hypothetical protein BJ878DRAFT_481741 [Calycina marina]|uniref:Uncharacterized protein n=1 Tax=Calycina marina TaxID=1763456 RepID=A0A9P7Z0N9_9HELO|nr:hypothetical protein BJ878DRAFT_481741 [Calycina marina]